ncbi:MAG: tRNA (adenosine(37)-N6)-dimethylallyltransferase MiaA [Porphyromonas sp.]|nr:tRNA (adenosine(37)-N6)-dimethylallyltransferase MiaA [Porphyromonas sp.]
MGVDLITLMGPTASGKTAVAAELAHLLPRGVVLSADSRQVYRGMDIGTGKDLDEYTIDGEEVPYYLIDICDAGERYNVHRYREDFFKIYEQLGPEVPKVLCGGTGQYIETVKGGFRMPDAPENPQLRSELEQLSTASLAGRLSQLNSEGVVDWQNRRRLVRAIEVEEYFRGQGTEVSYITYPPLSGPIFAIDVSREVRRERISARLTARLEGGMIQEVEQLLDQLQPEQLIYYGLEYKYVTEYLTGKLSYDEMKRQLEIAIHQFAKRQMTWIRGMERRGFTIHHIKPGESPRATAEEILSRVMSCDAS